ncbi:MAG: hypothetical protein RDU25_05930 [Patescibacteria group bacterium]|nr:hypothetical protein [Patescibacteria group bacterium]
MLPNANLQVRKLTHTHLTHRAQTLQAISQKAHAIDSRIEYLKVQGEKARKLLDDMPDDVSSRLAWLNSQLN